MAERPYSRYTRASTWAALFSQHLNAGYALVPLSATNNRIAVIRCKDANDGLGVLTGARQETDPCMGSGCATKSARVCSAMASNASTCPGPSGRGSRKPAGDSLAHQGKIPSPLRVSR